MRHRVSGKHLNRDANNRKALFRELVRSLITHGTITTTRAKAKEVKRIADKIISKATTDSLNSRRQLHKFFGKRDAVNALVENIGPATKRTSGFTTIKKVGVRRGDNTELYTLSLVDMPTNLGLKRPADAKSADKKTAAKKSVEKNPVAKKTVAKKTVAKKAPAKKTKSEKKA